MSQLAADQIRKWRERPDIFVREVFKVTPDPWQDEVLRNFPKSPRIAMKASKGVGKSACLAWLAWNFLLTRPDPKIAACSITSDNLRDCLWAEMALWRSKSPLLMEAFEWQKERIFSKERPEIWWMAARSWSKSADPSALGNTLAGLHADYIMFVLDESGGMPDAIMASAEAALSSCIEGHIVQAGNPTHLEGPLYRACTTERKLWLSISINADPDNPMRSPRVSMQWAKDQIDKYGRDNPWVKVNVFGEFPPASLNALLGPDDVEQAFNRKYQEADIVHAARLLGVDVARFGDDSSVIFPRQGLVAFKPHTMRNVDSLVGAGQVARVWQDWKVDACFIDNTGGYGAGWIDQLRLLNRQAIGVGFAEKAQDKRYYNRRAEMYFLMAEWVKAGGALPNVPELVAELTQTTYTFKGDSLLLEPKEDVKAKIGRSPDYSDSLALTFSQPVASKAVQALLPRSRQDDNYDPFAPFLR